MLLIVIAVYEPLAAELTLLWRRLWLLLLLLLMLMHDVFTPHDLPLHMCTSFLHKVLIKGWCVEARSHIPGTTRAREQERIGEHVRAQYFEATARKRSSNAPRTSMLPCVDPTSRAQVAVEAPPPPPPSDIAPGPTRFFHNLARLLQIESYSSSPLRSRSKFNSEISRLNGKRRR